MNTEEIQSLVDLRKFIIDCYNKLDGRTAPATAMIRQVDVADVYAQLIKRMDSLLSPYVKFQ